MRNFTLSDYQRVAREHHCRFLGVRDKRTGGVIYNQVPERTSSSNAVWFDEVFGEEFDVSCNALRRNTISSLDKMLEWMPRYEGLARFLGIRWLKVDNPYFPKNQKTVTKWRSARKGNIVAATYNQLYGSNLTKRLMNNLEIYSDDLYNLTRQDNFPDIFLDYLKETETT